MKKRILLVGVAVVLLAGLGQVLHQRRITLEEDLRLEAIRQLSLERVMGVNPDFHGRFVTLKGKVVSAGERTRAEAVVAAIDGVGGVINELDVVPPPPPVPLRYFLDVAWDSAGISVRGRVPDEETKALLLKRSALRYDAQTVRDHVEVDGSLGSGDWLGKVAQVLPEVAAETSPGRIKAVADRVVLAGVVASEASGKVLEETVRAELPGFEIESHLRAEDDASGL